mgnify:FL=1
MFAGMAASEHDQRSEIDLRVRIRLLLVLSEQIDELRHHLELELALAPAAGTSRHLFQRQHGIRVGPENGIIIPAPQPQHLGVGALHHLVEMQVHRVIFQTTSESVSDVGVGEISW